MVWKMRVMLTKKSDLKIEQEFQDDKEDPKCMTHGGRLLLAIFSGAKGF